MDGRPVAITTSDDGTARVWDLATGQATATLTGHTGSVRAVATAIVDGRPVAITTSDDRTARVWDLATGQATVTLTGHTGGVRGWPPRSSTAARWPSPPAAIDTARVWDLATGHATATLTGHTGARHGRWLPRSWMAARWPSPPETMAPPGCGTWPPARPPPPSPATTGRVTGVATAIVDGRPVAITTSYDRTARVWDLAVAGCQTILAFPDVLNCVAIAANGTVVLGNGP